MKPLFARLIGALIVTATLALGFAPAATAAPAAPAPRSAAPFAQDPGPSSVGATNACGGAANSSSKYASSSPLLPVNRWADATATMHSRLNNDWGADVGQMMQRHGVISAGMSTGNFMWSMGAGVSAFAINFCLLDSMGGKADEVGATIGNAVLGSGLLAGIVVISAFLLLLQARRRGGAPWKAIVTKAAIVGLLALMVGGATASTGGGINGSTAPYKPGLMSPGWVVTTLNKTVSSLASAPAAAMAMPKTPTGLYGADPLSCNNYVQSLKSGYQATYGQGADKLSASVPLILSTLWEGTGLQTWRTAQFGTNGLDANTYCRLLDWNSSSDIKVMGDSLAADKNNASSTVRGTLGRFWSQGWSESFYYSQAFQPTDNVSRDRSMVGWATCRLKDGAADPNSADAWVIQDAFAAGDKDKKVSTSDCKEWFTGKGDVPGAMDWPSGGSDVQKRTTTAPAGMDVRDFILTMHGNYNYQGMTSVFAYNLAAVCALLVFGGIALSIIVAKVAMVIMIITAFFLLIMCLLPSAGTDRLSGFLKMLLGMNMFVFGIQLIFALIAVLTKMLQGAGATFLGGDGSLFATVWTGISPLIAAYLLHMMFTKVMKVPSPFQLSAGLAWGASAAAAGGAAAAGVGALMDGAARRQGARAMGAARGAARRAGGAGLNRVMSAVPGRSGAGAVTRRGAAAPVGGEGARGKLPATGGMPGDIGSQRRGGAVVAGAFGGGTAAGAGKTMGGVSEGTEAPESASEDVQATGQPSENALPTGQQIRNSHADGTLDHLDLVNSNVPNSQLGRGNLSAEERKALNGAAAVERVMAEKYEARRRSELGLEPKPATKRGRAAAAFADTWSDVQQQYREKPLRTLGKHATVGAVAVMAAPAFAAAPVIVPAAAAVGAVVAKTAGRSALANTRTAKRQASDVRVDNYRQAMRGELKRRDSEEKKSKPNEKQGTNPVTGKTPGTGNPAAGSPQVQKATGGVSLKSSAPVTEQLPVV